MRRKNIEPGITFERLKSDIFDFCKEHNLYLPVYIEEWAEANTNLEDNNVYVIKYGEKPVGLMQAWMSFNNACLTINPIEISEDMCGKGLGTKAVKSILSGNSIFGRIHYISADATPESCGFWLKQGACMEFDGSYAFTLSAERKVDANA